MPKRLLERCRPDSILEFQSAARQRFQDGLCLAPNGRRTAAIYIWGYAAEMTLKAAYFRLIGFAPNQAITMADLKGAKANAPRVGFTWFGNLHNLESWALLLISTRASGIALTYSIPAFGNEVMASSRRLQQSWSEVLRYHKNVAYLHEVDRARSATEWLLMNEPQL